MHQPSRIGSKDSVVHLTMYCDEVTTELHINYNAYKRHKKKQSSWSACRLYMWPLSHRYNFDTNTNGLMKLVLLCVGLLCWSEVVSVKNIHVCWSTSAVDKCKAIKQYRATCIAGHLPTALGTSLTGKQHHILVCVCVCVCVFLHRWRIRSYGRIIVLHVSSSTILRNNWQRSGLHNSSRSSNRSSSSKGRLAGLMTRRRHCFPIKGYLLATRLLQ